jgi:hypothetical protein
MYQNHNANFSKSNKEEIFMYLSIFVALVAYKLNINWLVWLFGIKAVIEAIGSIRLANKYYQYKKQQQKFWNENQKN